MDEINTIESPSILHKISENINRNFQPQYRNWNFKIEIGYFLHQGAIDESPARLYLAIPAIMQSSHESHTVAW